MNIDQDLDQLGELKRLVAFLEEHPDLDWSPVTVMVHCDEYSGTEEERHAGTRAKLRSAVRQMKDAGRVDKRYGDEVTSAVVRFGPHEVKAMAWASAVCERVQVGVDVVPAKPEQVIPATPAQTVPRFETRCAPLLPEDENDLVDGALEEPLAGLHAMREGAASAGVELDEKDATAYENEGAASDSAQAQEAAERARAEEPF